MTVHDLAKASAAEDFFVILDVAFDQHVLDVHRLHLLNRFRRYMADSGGTDPRDCLERAYADFARAEKAPREFKVFGGHKGFVPLKALLGG